MGERSGLESRKSFPANGAASERRGDQSARPEESEDNRGPEMDTLGETVITGKKRKKAPWRKQKRNNHRGRNRPETNQDFPGGTEHECQLDRRLN